jgi:hypothetical protein
MTKEDAKPLVHESLYNLLVSSSKETVRSEKGVTRYHRKEEDDDEEEEQDKK